MCVFERERENSHIQIFKYFCRLILFGSHPVDLQGTVNIFAVRLFTFYSDWRGQVEEPSNDRPTDFFF